MSEYHIHIAVFQKAKLNPKNRTPSLGPNYILLRKDRQQDGGGLVTAIHKSFLHDELVIQNSGRAKPICI